MEKEEEEDTIYYELDVYSRSLHICQIVNCLNLSRCALFIKATMFSVSVSNKSHNFYHSFVFLLLTIFFLIRKVFCPRCVAVSCFT